MRVQFLVDFRGKLTGEIFYRVGETAEFSPATAQALIDEGRAVLVPEPTPEIAPVQPAKMVRKIQRGNTLTGGGAL